MISIDPRSGQRINVNTESLPPEALSQPVANIALLKKKNEEAQGPDITGRVMETLAEKQVLDTQDSCPISVSGGNDGILRIWNNVDSSVSNMVPFQHRTYGISLSPHCNLIAASDEFGYTELIDLQTKHAVQTFAPTTNKSILLGFDYSGESISFVHGHNTELYLIGSEISPSSFAVDGAFAARDIGGDLVIVRAASPHASEALVIEAGSHTIIDSFLLPTAADSLQYTTIVPLEYFHSTRRLALIIDKNVVVLEHIAGEAPNAAIAYGILQTVDTSEFIGEMRPRRIGQGQWLVPSGAKYFILDFRNLDDRLVSATAVAISKPIVIPKDDHVMLALPNQNGGFFLATKRQLMSIDHFGNTLLPLYSQKDACQSVFFKFNQTIFVQREKDKSGLCRDEFSTVKEPLRPQAIVRNGVAADWEHWGKRLFYVSDGALVSEQTTDGKRCSITLPKGPVSLGPNDGFGIAEDGDSWLSGIEGTFSGWIREKSKAVKIYVNPNQDLVTIVERAQVSTFVAATCRIKSTYIYHSDGPEGAIIRYQPSAEGESLMLGTGQDDVTIFASLETGAELAQLNLHGESWHFTAGADGDRWIAEGYRPPFQMIPLTSDFRRVLDLRFEDLRTLVLDYMTLDCATSDTCAPGEQRPINFPPDEMEVSDIAACTALVRHPMEVYSGEQGYAEDIAAQPFFERGGDPDACFERYSNIGTDGRADFSRARHLWGQGDRAGSLAALISAAKAGHALAGTVANSLRELNGRYGLLEDRIGALAHLESRRNEALALFHFVGTTEFGSLGQKLQFGIRIGDPFSEALGGEILLAVNSSNNSSAENDGLALLRHCMEDAHASGMGSARAYCRRLILNQIKLGNDCWRQADVDIEEAKRRAIAIIGEKVEADLRERTFAF